MGTEADAECVFCHIVAGEAPAASVFEDDGFIAFMDINPINPGHVLVLPKVHRETLFDLDDREVVALFLRVAQIADAVKDAVGADGMNIGQNNGRAANQIVDHVHVHVIPRYEDDSPAGRWPDRKTVPVEDLEAVAQEIRGVVRGRPIGEAPPGS